MQLLRQLNRFAGGYLVYPTLAFLLVLSSGKSWSADLISQTLCDLEVLYVFDQAESIDWPTLYYLNEEYGTSIELLTLGAGDNFRYTVNEVPEKDISLYKYHIAGDDTLMIDSVVAVHYRARQPDVIILSHQAGDSTYERLASMLTTYPTEAGSIFGVRKVYRNFLTGADSTGLTRSVTVNRRELAGRYRERMLLELPLLYSWWVDVESTEPRLMHYQLVLESSLSGEGIPDFLSGLQPLRLIPVFDSCLDQSAVRRALTNRARNFISLFHLSRNTVGAHRVENLIAGYKELIALDEQVRSESRLAALPGLKGYMSWLLERARKAVLEEIGMDWKGRIILRDSPHGPKLKFRASLSNNGPKTIELSYIRFHPYWDSVLVVLEPTSRKISPHQAFVREYLVDIDRSRLEAQMPESLVFTADIVYGTIPLTVTSAVPIWEKPDLKIEFEPDFYFVPPVARLNVDKVVSAMNWKAVITKSRYYKGETGVNLETPRGVFAGAYRQTIQLEKGHTTETIRIPFSISNLFELGMHHQTITLSVNGRTVAVDTGRICIAACEVPNTISIGFLPDTTGLLEDILRMTQARFRPLTDRALRTGDLDAYDVIVVGSGALLSNPSFRLIRGRLESYLRWGGSLVVLGQPEDWPEDMLPVSFVPSSEIVVENELLNRNPDARVLSHPHKISGSDMLTWFKRPRTVSGAVISPTEKVYVTPSGATLLSVSRLGDGQIIFCGLPLLEMVSELNIEAIHLLANILNY